AGCSLASVSASQRDRFLVRFLAQMITSTEHPLYSPIDRLDSLTMHLLGQDLDHLRTDLGHLVAILRADPAASGNKIGHSNGPPEAVETGPRSLFSSRHRSEFHLMTAN